MSDRDKEDGMLRGLHRIMDFVEPAAAKVEKALSNVHTPDKEYPSNEGRDPNVIDAEIVSETPPSYAFGGVAGSDGRGIIWHAFERTSGITICGRTFRPEVWWVPNPSSRQAVLCCFGCLSRLAQLTPTRKALTP